MRRNKNRQANIQERVGVSVLWVRVKVETRESIRGKRKGVKSQVETTALKVTIMLVFVAIMALNKALCFFFVNNLLRWRKADGSTYLCIYLDLVDSISQHSLCYGLAATSRSQAKQMILHLIKTYEGQKHSYKQKKLKIAQGSLIAFLQQTVWTRKWEWLQLSVVFIPLFLF